MHAVGWAVCAPRRRSVPARGSLLSCLRAGRRAVRRLARRDADTYREVRCEASAQGRQRLPADIFSGRADSVHFHAQSSRSEDERARSRAAFQQRFRAASDRSDRAIRTAQRRDAFRRLRHDGVGSGRDFDADTRQAQTWQHRSAHDRHGMQDSRDRGRRPRGAVRGRGRVVHPRPAGDEGLLEQA